MQEIYVTRPFFEASGPQGHCFEKPVFRYGLGECVHQISDLYHFSFDQEVLCIPQTNRPIQKWK